MPPILAEWLNLLLRVAHVLVAILWIGDSFLFMWLDARLSRPSAPRTGDVVGELWMTHSGGFYEVVKRRSLEALPERLHWFRWQSYATWITGVLLLIVVYGLGGRAMLLDVASPLSHGAGFAIAIGLLVLGVALYDFLCRVRFLADDRALGAVGLLLIAATSWLLVRLFVPRAAFLVLGAILGSIMTSNVFFNIIPAQRHMLAATREGRAVDTSYGARAKQRSTHNHYLTLPVLFLMVSNHFPSFFGSPHAWIVMGLMTAGGAGIKLVMNQRSRTPVLAWAGTLASLLAVAVLTRPPGDSSAVKALAGHAPVEIEAARAIVQMRCVTCHAARPGNAAFAAAPNGVMLDRPEHMEAYAGRILQRVFEDRTMPLGNLTGMTEEERVVLGAWAYQQRRR